MKKIWEEIQKPEEMKGKNADEFLDLYFESLPHFQF